MKRCAVAFASIALLAAGCKDDPGSTPKRGGTIHLAQRADVVTLNPYVAIDLESIHVLSQIVEPTYRVDVRGKIVPWLVSGESQSADRRTWTFRLRDGVRFSDGKRLTAEDVVFSLDEARKSANFGGLFAAVKDVRAKGAASVVITTKQPVAPMLANLSLYAAGIVPKDYGGITAKQFGQKPVGTGPFKLGRWNRGESLTLDRNPGYWRKGRPLLDRVVVEGLSNDSSRVSQLRGRQLELADAPPWPQLDSLERTPDVKVGQYALAHADYVLLNTHKPLFRDPRVREAAKLAIDRESIVSTALRGAGKPGGAFLPPVLPYHDASIAPPAQDLAEARALLDEARKDGAPEPSFTLLITAGDTFVSTAAQIVQQNLNDAGFDVKLQPVDQSVVIDQASAGKYDAAILYLVSDIVDPSELVATYTALKGFFTGADTSAVSSLASAADSESDPTKRRDLYYRIQQQIDRASSVLTLDYQPFVWAYRADVVGFEIGPTGIYWLADVGLAG